MSEYGAVETYLGVLAETGDCCVHATLNTAFSLSLSIRGDVRTEGFHIREVSTYSMLKATVICSVMLKYKTNCYRIVLDAAINLSFFLESYRGVSTYPPHMLLPLTEIINADVEILNSKTTPFF